MNSVAQNPAFRLGVLDAKDGFACIPEMYFADRNQLVDYALGYESVTGPTLLSQQILATVANAESMVAA